MVTASFLNQLQTISSIIFGSSISHLAICHHGGRPCEARRDQTRFMLTQLTRDDQQYFVLYFRDCKLGNVIHDRTDGECRFGRFVRVDSCEDSESQETFDIYLNYSIAMQRIIIAGESPLSLFKGPDDQMQKIFQCLESSDWLLIDYFGDKHTIVAPIFQTAERIVWISEKEIKGVGH